MLCGLALAVFSGSMALALLGGVIAMVSTVVPVPEGRKHRWRKRVLSLRQPIIIRVPHPVDVCFDGTSVIFRKNGERVRQVRLVSGEGRAFLHRVDSRVALEFRPQSGGRHGKIWLVTTADETLGLDSKALSTQDSGHLSMPVTVSCADWKLMKEATASAGT